VGRAVPFPPRFRSQVFSTSQRFQRARVARPCFVPQPFLGFSLQSLPLTEIVYPFRGHLCSPAVIHRRAGLPVSAALSPPVSPTPALSTQLPGSPDGYGLPFHESRPASRLPWAPGVCRPFRQLHPLRSFPPPVSPFAPSPGFPGWTAAALLGFCPSRVPFQTSEPRTLRRDSTPASGETFPLSRATTGQPRRQPPIPFGTGPRRLSTASPSPPALDRRLPAGPDPRSLEVPER
jgi:hypothetical protein